MKGDFSRWTFDPGKHYHGVLKQQGRVDVDADWNEQGAIASHRVETETVDVVGQCGAPAANPGFLLTASGKDLTIGAGRAYVDGILCENGAALSITAQPDLPGFQLPSAPGIYVAYLRVWLRHVTALDDAHIREDSLGGPDTCSRSHTVWQVGLLQPKVTGNITCSTSLPEWDSLIAASTGTLAARAQPDPTSTDPCMIPAKAGYRSLENQLYRVEIHGGGSGGTATYKWSRDNGSVVTAWTGVSGNDLAVTSTGRDGVLGFAAGQWVELTDDTHELNFQPGTLAQVTNVEGNTITIDPSTATGPTAFAGFPLNPRVRRWDSAGAVTTKAGSWINLENGVQVEFSAGSYAPGDYWMIPARTLKADVEWPLDASGNPLPQTPRGIDRHYCKLALLTFNGSAWAVTSTCLPTFPPLVSLSATAAAEAGIHVTAVRFLQHNLNFLNDSDVPLAMLTEGIAIVCDAPVAPHSIKRPTFFVTVELPFSATVAGVPTVGQTILAQASQATLALSNTAAPAATIAVKTNPTPGLTINANAAATPTTDATTAAAAAAVAPILGFHPLMLAAKTSLSTDNLTIQWSVANAEILRYLQSILLKLQADKEDPRLLTHITLKGNFIWGPNDRLAQTYLDGEAYGVQRLDDPKDATNVHTSLKLPKSGDGQRGGDFEMWFWLVLPVSLVSLTFNPTTAATGGVATGTLTLSAPAPDGGAVVTLASNNTKLATIPATATVASGQTTGTFPVTGIASSTAVSTLQVTATYLDSTATGTLTIQGPPPK
ncbi:MAG TPA: DUF6519 domain-containing protein [Candidatus Sulfopaludibacter sp.]|jgi:hypothetical protein|nr:DUF6519 domain-containing protein [Candidatus Sulfopaludibacter sp.]